jgi:hypothetical protein
MGSHPRGSSDPGEVFGKGLVVMSSRRAIPPEVIALNRIEDSPLPFVVDHGRHFGLFLAFVKKSVHGHHPSKKKPMLLHSLNAVG